MDKKNNHDVNELLEKLSFWYDILDYYIANSDLQRQGKQDFKYIYNAIMELDKDKKADHLRFAKKFKSLFDKKNKVLAEENIEIKKELYKEKVEKVKLERKLVETERIDNDW